MKHFILTTSFIFMLVNVVYCQMGITLGTSTSRPDTRTYLVFNHNDGLGNERVINDDPTYDNEFFISLFYVNTHKEKFFMKYGLGLSVNHNDFSIPIHSIEYFKAGNKAGWVNDWYFNSNVQFQVQPSYEVGQFKELKVRISGNAMYNLSFYKLIYLRDNDQFKTYFRKLKLNSYSFEFLPSLDIAFRKSIFSLGYRLFHIKFLDPAITNNGKKLDPYNPFKLRFSYSYLF